MMVVVFILMMLAAALPGALSARSEPEADAPQASRRPAPRIDRHDISGYVLASFAGLMIFGLAVTYQTERQRQTLADKLCAAADNRISETWKARGDKALSFTEAILKRDLHGKIPCLEGPAE
ncbi:hypothetical protein [Vannielia sp.]|uniref:hypothetical protein n=1 Tax=Vannielia sp. TaxID=2813045 RepID=UPI002625693F|nr:hypothetical protein [Vannielia sp.]MDF1872111.1 hypothetical protein [Vannielia sp.]